MAIPEKSRDQIIEAMQKFDNELRNTPEWIGWDKKLNFKFAISFEDRPYPVKEIIRLATEFTDFSGGEEANSYLRKKGFIIVPLHEDDLELDENLNIDKLVKVLQSFAKFRQENEERYFKEERGYKLEILHYLQEIFSTLITEPEKSKVRLRDLMAGKHIDPMLLRALDNLLGNWFAVQRREDFRVFLENIDQILFKNLFSDLFDEEREIKERFREFRLKINEIYLQFYNAGKFSVEKKNKPNFSATFTAILLAGYNYKNYILYKPTEYTYFLEYLGIPVPGSVEDKYKLFLEVARFIVKFAADNKLPIQDLIDAHNMIFMFNNYEEMKIEDAIKIPKVKSQEKNVYQYIKGQAFFFPATVITDYILALFTKPFVILSGISGTGKTKIAQLVAEYITGGDRNRVAFIPVRPDWTDNSALLGYYNTITEIYEVTPLLELLLRAKDNPGQAHFVLLDEMNIAKVEHYFSDFLSCLESRRVIGKREIIQEPVRLHNRMEVTYQDSEGKEREIPSLLEIPRNVFFTGTVNVDETTYMFSPKVLDRANTIEFNEVYLEGPEVEESVALVIKDNLDLNELLINSKLPSWEHLKTLQEKFKSYYDLLVDINRQLCRYNLHFGYRVANEISAFLLNVVQYCRQEEKGLETAFDLQIMQKILPKFHGNITKLQEPLESLQQIIGDRFPVSRRKIDRMLNLLQEQGFSSFIE
ncbi:MAG: AAA family ATPase [Firmicutes bacterium]|nr:AAA family ATPase [Bacillota bacterium]